MYVSSALDLFLSFRYWKYIIRHSSFLNVSAFHVSETGILKRLTVRDVFRIRYGGEVVLILFIGKYAYGSTMRLYLRLYRGMYFRRTFRFLPRLRSRSRSCSIKFHVTCDLSTWSRNERFDGENCDRSSIVPRKYIGWLAVNGVKALISGQEDFTRFSEIGFTV